MIPSFEMLGNGSGGGKNAVAMASSSLFVVGSAFKAFAKVSEGERGVRTNMGRATRTKGRREGQLYGIVKPGYHLVMPFTHAIRTVSVQNMPKDLENMQVNCNEGRQFLVAASITWAVRSDGDNPFRALFNVETKGALAENVGNICTAGLRTVIDGTTEEAMKNDREIASNVKDICRDDLLEYGSELRKVNITTVTRTFGQMIVEANVQPSQAMLGSDIGMNNKAAPLHVAN